MKKSIKKILYIFFILLILNTVPCQGTGADIPDPTNHFFVNDFAEVLDTESEQYIQNIAVELQERTSAQVVVVTIDSLQGEPLETYALKLFREWGIGTSEKNNGVLLLVAIEDRMSRIEVGYGLEGALPDGKTGRIQDEYMIPAFQGGNYALGIVQGFTVLVQEVYKEYGIDIENLTEQPAFHIPEKQERANNTKQIITLIAVFVLLLLDWIFLGGRITRFLLMVALSRHRGGGGRHGGGGGFSGGGGRSGGGGSSRGW